MFKQISRVTLLACSLFLFFSCGKDIPKGNIMRGQIAITFDDAYIENWRQYLPLLDSLNIKATFYISSYHKFDAKKKAWLKEIESHGHEIAFHTATHPDMAKEVAKNGLSKVEEKEIKTDLKMMRADGYACTNFAYPYGSHTAQLNTCLLRTFKSVRALSNQQNYYKSLVKESGEGKVLYGANIDNNSRLTNDKIVSLMNDAQAHNDCLVMVAHMINTPSVGLQISRDRLRLIAKTAKEKDLRFITINEISF